MKPNKINMGTLFAAVIVSLLLIGCAKPYHFYVKYNPPASSESLKGRIVNLQILDGRDSKNFFSETAGKEFNLWDGEFAMYNTPKKPKGDIQSYPLIGLIEAAMKKHLESMGITVVIEKVVIEKLDDTPLLEVTLNQFFLDLNDRTWVSDFSYEVKLTGDNQKISREKVSGQAERTKIMGRGAGEILVSDIFTESINKLNIEKLFKNASL